MKHVVETNCVENSNWGDLNQNDNETVKKKTEAVKIASSTATNLLNSKAEHRQPALLRVRMVQGDDSDVQGPRPGAGDGGGGGGGEGEGDEQAGHRGRRRRGE